MMTYNRNDDWESFHIFLSDPRRSEAWMAEFLFPAAGRWVQDGRIKDWFFIRYWEGGPHIRVRLRGLDDDTAPVIRQALTDSVIGFLADTPLDRDTYYAAHSFDGEPRDAADLPWFGEGAVEPINYEPEWQRYGGRDAMVASEDLFAISSRLCAGLIGGTRDDNAGRLPKAAIVMTATILATGMDDAQARAFAARYYTMWSAYSSATREQAARAVVWPETAEQTARRSAQLFAAARTASAPGGAIEAWSSAVADWTSKITALGKQGRLLDPISGQSAKLENLFETIGVLLASHIHMTNNRLGLTPNLEMVLASQIAGQELADTAIGAAVTGKTEREPA